MADNGAPRRGGAWLLAGAAAALLVAAGVVRATVVPVRDTLALVGVDADTVVLWTHLTVANTGLLDDQLTTRLVLLPAPGNDPLEHRAVQGPTAPPGPDGVGAGTDALRPVEDGWELRVGGEGLAARIRARGATVGCPPTPGDLAGFVEDRGVEGRLVTGRGVVVHTRVEGDPEADALYVLGPAFAAGVDPLSDCPAWVVAGDATWTGTPPPLDPSPRATLRLGDWALTFRHVGPAVDQAPLGHVLPPERWLAAAMGYAPRLRARRVTLRVSGPGVDGVRAGLLVERGPAAASSERRRASSPARR